MSWKSVGFGFYGKPAQPTVDTRRGRETSAGRATVAPPTRKETVGTLTRAEIDAGSRRSIEVLSGMPGVVWIRSYVSDVDGKIYCEYEAPNPEAILEHARRVGLPVDRITEIALEISPAMFR
jgi:Protein of unknown function (DUF4242)